jgi:hypothetical protein
MEVGRYRPEPELETAESIWPDAADSAADAEDDPVSAPLTLV